MDWNDLFEVVVCCECGIELSGFINLGNFLTSVGSVSFSGRTVHHCLII